MPKQQLRPQFVANPPKPDKPKIDYFDTQTPGFLLEVRSSGKATYYLRYRDPGGTVKQVKLGNPEHLSLDEARSKAKSLKSQTALGFDPKAEQEKLKAIPTFKNFVYEKYLPYAKTYKRSWQADQKMIEHRMLRLWGKRKLDNISTQDIVEFKNGLVQGGLKPGSVNRYMALVKYLFSLAERWEIIDKAPTRNIGKLQDNGARERYLTQEEIERLFEALNTNQSQVVPDIVEMLLLTGARKSEVVGMEWQEVDMERGLWTIPAERNKAKKSKVLPLSEAALGVLNRRTGNGSEYVFPNPQTGEPLKHFHNTWDRIREKAGLPGVRIHDLRHSFASTLVNRGRSLYEVQKLLGHSQLSTTQRYSHLTQDTLKDACEIAGRSMGIRKVKNED